MISQSWVGKGYGFLLLRASGREIARYVCSDIFDAPSSPVQFRSEFNRFHKSNAEFSRTIQLTMYVIRVRARVSPSSRRRPSVSPVPGFSLRTAAGYDVRLQCTTSIYGFIPANDIVF